MTSIERQQYWQQQVADKQYDTASGRIRYMRLDPLSVTPIQRHAKIKGGYNRSILHGNGKVKYFVRGE